jgi:hypothetical protein
MKKMDQFPHLKRIEYSVLRNGRTFRFDPYAITFEFLAEEEQLTLPGTNDVRDTYAVHHGDIKMSIGNYVKFIDMAYENNDELMVSAGINFYQDYVVYNIRRMTIDEFNGLDPVITDDVENEDFVVYGNTKMTLNEFVNKLRNSPSIRRNPPPVRSPVRNPPRVRSPEREVSPPPIRRNQSPPRSPERSPVRSPVRSPARNQSPPRNRSPPRSPPRQRSPGVPVPSGSFVEIQVDEDDACPICLEGFDLQNLKIVKCKYNNLHKIHKDCIAKFRAHNPEAPCFQCRPVK